MAQRRAWVRIWWSAIWASDPAAGDPIGRSSGAKIVISPPRRFPCEVYGLSDAEFMTGARGASRRMQRAVSAVTALASSSIQAYIYAQTGAFWPCEILVRPRAVPCEEGPN